MDALGGWWLDTKIWLVGLSGLDRDSLHVHASVVILLAAALLLRRPVSHPLPWLVVLALELLNEAADIQPHWHEAAMPDGMWELVGLDIANTMALPTLLLVAARLLPQLFVRRPAVAAEAADGAPALAAGPTAP